MRTFSVAMTSIVHRDLQSHLVRDDEDEDLCFLVWRTSAGQCRDTAVVYEIVLPEDGDRHVHGNVSFESAYFLRACDRAVELGGGVALIHSHPRSTGWQGMSRDDSAAESGHAAQALALTGLPLVGLTMAGASRTYSARRWHRHDTPRWSPQLADSVRVIGDHMMVSLPPAPTQFDPAYQRRTIDSWGEHIQTVIGSLRVAVVGAGSVGSQIIESLARTGIGQMLVMDFDTVQEHNLDRTLNATLADAVAGRLKAQVAAEAAAAHATHPRFVVSYTDFSAVEPGGIALLKDCDLIFCCVDRPAGRQALNALAYGHLIPVVDGGVMVDPGRTRMRGATWRAHIATVGRRCLECLGQFDPGLVQADRDGLLDDSTYLARLPENHALKRGENVYALSAAAASEQVLAALRMIVAPAGIADVGAQTFHFATGTSDHDIRECESHCLTHSISGHGDAAGLPVPARHVPAETARGAARPRYVEVAASGLPVEVAPVGIIARVRLLARRLWAHVSER